MSYRRAGAGAENARRRRTAIRLLRSPLIAAAALHVASAAAQETPPSYETVVTGARPAERPREDLSASASVITADRTPRAGEDLPRLLSELPGLVITRYGSSGSLATASVRGSGPNQVAVYADGVPLDSALTGSIDLGLIPLTAAQRIEVYRGTSPLPYGSSAMGGVLSLTSEAPRRTQLSLHTGLGSFTTLHGGAEAAWVHGRGSVVARAAAFDSQADFPYRSDNRTLFDPSDDRTLRRQNNQLHQLDAALRAALALSRARELRLSLSALGRRQGLPARGTDQAFAATLDRRRLVASASYESTADLGLASRLRATGYLLLGEQRLDDRLGEVAFTPTSTRDRSRTVGATAVATRALGTWLALSALLDARGESFRPQEELRPDRRPPGQRLMGAAALSGTADLPALNLQVVASARAEAARDQVSPADTFGGRTEAGPPSRQLLPIARLGLVQSPHPALRLRANLGSYARLPTLFERYGNGGIIVGNPALRPERGLNTDLGGGWRLARGPAVLDLDAAFFAARAHDLIHFQQMGYFAGYLNVAASRSAGVELSASGRWGDWGRLFLQATAMDLRDRSGLSGRDGRLLPHQPRLRGYLRPELAALALGRRWQAGLYADAELTGSQFHDPANLVRQPARLVLGAGAHLDHPGWRLLLSGYNLGDTRVADVVEFPLPGRSFFVSLCFTYPAI